MKIQTRLITLIIAILPLLLINSCKKDRDDRLPKAVAIYFTSLYENTVSKIDLTGKTYSATQLYESLDGINTPEGIAMTSDGYLLVTDEFGNRIIKVTQNTPRAVFLLYESADGVKEPTAIGIDNTTSTIYWCNSGDKQVKKGSYDGDAIPENMFVGIREIIYTYGMAVDEKNKKLYLSDFKKFIKVGNLDGSGNMTVLYDNISFPQMVAPSGICIDPDHGKMYWTDETANLVVEANIDGTGTPVVLFDSSDGVNRPDAIAIDYNDHKIYWSETGSKVIARGNIDGSGEREVLVENVQSYGIVLDIK
jgi:DNA-binding beta-propeller fold protein YncE